MKTKISPPKEYVSLWLEITAVLLVILFFIVDILNNKLECKCDYAEAVGMSIFALIGD